MSLEKDTDVYGTVCCEGLAPIYFPTSNALRCCVILSLIRLRENQRLTFGIRLATWLLPEKINQPEIYFQPVNK